MRWPDEFPNPIPAVSFGPEFITFLKELVGNGATITANEHWSFFLIRRDDRIVDFIWRGRLRRGKPECWEVHLSSNGKETLLGRVFGIGDYACVVTAELDRIRTVTMMWLNGDDLASIIAVVPFWDRRNTLDKLKLPQNPNHRQCG